MHDVLDLCVRPRATIRRILERDPRRYVLGLIILESYTVADKFMSGRFAELLPLALLRPVAIALTPLVLLPAVYAVAGLLEISGRALGGRATSLEIRAVLAWAGIPMLAWLAMRIQVAALAGDPGLALHGILEVDPQTRATLDSALQVLVVPASIWELVLRYHGLCEAQAFSGLRLIASVLLAIAIPVVPAVIAALLLT